MQANCCILHVILQDIKYNLLSTILIMLRRLYKMFDTELWYVFASNL